MILALSTVDKMSKEERAMLISAHMLLTALRGLLERLNPTWNHENIGGRIISKEKV